MAERPLKYQFKSVQLLKNQSLGIGSYGAVCKAKCDDLLCAAKIIHPTLFDPTALLQIAPQREHRLPIRRFEQECVFMSAIRHPNIVQYLGMFREIDSHLPVLLMELMDDSLTYFLESAIQPIPYHIQVNICHDITLALSFLHSNSIVHRDLSSNNILLRGNVIAKVTDFGMARLGDITQATRFTNTMCPGTDVYMPPEAVQDKPVYTEKIDCFSFGVITIQILTRLFPKPGDRLQEIEFSHPGLPQGKLLVQSPEVDRRQNHISQVNSDNLLLPVALGCLKDKYSERPSAHQLCERVAGLKRMPKYTDSVRSVQDKDEVIRSQAICIEEKDHTIASKENEIQQLRQEKDQLLEERERELRQINLQLRQLQLEKDQELGEKTRQLEEKERQLRRTSQQLEASEQMVAQFERQIAGLKQQPSTQREWQKTKPSYKENELSSFELGWREGRRAPCKLSRWCDAVVDGSTVYVRNEGSTANIFSYDVTSNSWFKLPDCVHKSGSIAIINGWLTTVGGGSYMYSNELFSLTKEGSSRRWTKKFPSMPTKRRLTTAVCTGSILIVAGGEGESGRVLSTVEVMNTENHQWFIAADLPQPMHRASATVCGDHLYMLGGISEDNTPTKSVYTCSVSDILQSYVSSSSLEFKRVNKASIWNQISQLPVTRSTCESFHGRLLAIGGYDSDSWKYTTAIFVYKSTTDSWEIISHMITGRSRCFTAVLPDSQLMVVGGYTNNGVTDTMELSLTSLCEQK